MRRNQNVSLSHLIYFWIVREIRPNTNTTSIAQYKEEDLSYNRTQCYRMTNLPFTLHVIFRFSLLHSYWNSLLAFHQGHVENRAMWFRRVGIHKYLSRCDFNLLRVIGSTKSRINCDRMHVAGKLIKMSLSAPVCGVRRSSIFATENWTWTIIRSLHDWHWLCEWERSEWKIPKLSHLSFLLLRLMVDQHD